MIHELRMYTVKPGTVGKVLEASGTVAQRIRNGDTYGKLEGHWSSEIGPLNQYVHLWAYQDIGEMARLRAELAAQEAWRKEFVPLVAPHIVNQRIRILRPIVAMKTPDSEGNIYELRSYRIKLGKATELCQRFSEYLPAREKYSLNIGLWMSELPDPNEINHIWVYSSFEQRLQARAQAQADPDWQAFLSYAGPLIEQMNSMLLMPSPYSPRK